MLGPLTKRRFVTFALLIASWTAGCIYLRVLRVPLFAAVFGQFPWLPEPVIFNFFVVLSFSSFFPAEFLQEVLFMGPRFARRELVLAIRSAALLATLLPGSWVLADDQDVVFTIDPTQSTFALLDRWGHLRHLTPPVSTGSNISPVSGHFLVSFRSTDRYADKHPMSHRGRWLLPARSADDCA